MDARATPRPLQGLTAATGRREVRRPGRAQQGRPARGRRRRPIPVTARARESEPVTAVGATNVSLVYLGWSHLPDRPFRLLAYMALVSLDTDVPPRYFGGYPALARALGRNTPDAFDRHSATDSQRRAFKADMEAVRNALSPLLAASAVIVDRPEAPGRGPEFALVLDERSRRSLPDGPGDACQRSRDGLPTVQVSPADLGGVGGETLYEEPRGEVRNTRGTTSPQATKSLANPAGNSKGQQSEVDRQSAALFAKYPEES